MLHLVKASDYKGETKQIWDRITSKQTQDKYYLVSTVSQFSGVCKIITKYGNVCVKKGKLDTFSCTLPFNGPFEQLQHAGESLGVFAKLYKNPKYKTTCKKEFDCLEFLSSRNTSLPNLITSDNFPKPRCLENQLLLLPLILTATKLRHFCQSKTEFYEKMFSFTPDLSRVLQSLPPEQMKEARRRKLYKRLERFLITVFLWKRANAIGFYHGDMEVKENMMLEDLSSVLHRHLGRWPPNHTVGVELATSLDCNAAFRYSGQPLPVLIDYDFVYYGGRSKKPFLDYYLESFHIISVYNENDLMKYYDRFVVDHLGLMERVAIAHITGNCKHCAKRYRYCRYQEGATPCCTYDASYHRMHCHHGKTLSASKKADPKRLCCIYHINREIKSLMKALHLVIRKRYLLDLNQLSILADQFRSLCYLPAGADSNKVDFWIRVLISDQTENVLHLEKPPIAGTDGCQ